MKKLKLMTQEASTNAHIEAEYLKCKKNGFNHPPEVEEQIKLCRDLHKELSTFCKDVSDIVKLEKEMAAAEAKFASNLAAAVDTPGQHPQIKTYYQTVSSHRTMYATDRFAYNNALDSINEEWKGMETDLKALKAKKKQINKLWAAKKYYEKDKKNQGKVADAENKYRGLVAETVKQIQDLREKKEASLPAYLLRSSQAEMDYHRKAYEQATSLHSALEQVGSVTPIPFDGYDKFAFIPTPLPADCSPIPSPLPSPRPPASPRGTSSAPPSSNPPPPSSNPPPPSFAPPPPSFAPPPPSVIPPANQARALYPFTAQKEDELSLQIGDVMTVLARNGDWWTVDLQGRVGLVPSNYIQTI